MGRGAWWATVPKSQTRLSNQHFTFISVIPSRAVAQSGFGTYFVDFNWVTHRHLLGTSSVQGIGDTQPGTAQIQSLPGGAKREGENKLVSSQGFSGPRCQASRRDTKSGRVSWRKWLRYTETQGQVGLTSDPEVWRVLAEQSRQRLRSWVRSQCSWGQGGRGKLYWDLFGGISGAFVGFVGGEGRDVSCVLTVAGARAGLWQEVLHGA